MPNGFANGPRARSPARRKVAVQRGGISHERSMRRSANAESQFWAVLGTRHARRLCSCIIARASPRADVLTQDAPHFLDRLGMPLCRVAGADDFFRLDALDVGAFEGTTPSVFPVIGSSPSTAMI